MADVPIDCDFPVWGLLPKRETGVVSFINKYPEYDGRGTIIAIFDSGVDPAATGLTTTSTGETKVIERYDCSGCGDVETTTVVTKIEDGCITGLTGRKMTIPLNWTNPSGEWRLGVLQPFYLYPSKVKDRLQDYRRIHQWDVGHKPAFAKANQDLQDFEKEKGTSNLSYEDKIQKEELEARVDILLNADKKLSDYGPSYDCVLFYDGNVWRACIDTSERGDLASGVFLGEYSKTHEHSHLTSLDEMTVSINVHDEGNVLEVVGMCSTHGTHVAAIASGYFPDEPEKNGVAPGAKIISLSIGDSRLGSMETGTALVRACIKVMELSKKMKIDVINMSYGEHAHWANTGRVGEIICEVVNRYGVAWVVSAGNHGPALCTVGAPPDITQSVLIGVGAYVSPEMMAATYSMRARMCGGAFSWSSRGPTGDGALGVSVCAPGGAITSVARFMLRKTQLMNGTSMAAPHVAGAVATLISGLKALRLPYSPYSVKRALENASTYLAHVEPWAQGCGLLNIEKAFVILSTFANEPERDVTFSFACGPTNSKGVILRPKYGDKPVDMAVNIEPCFLRDHEDLENKDLQKKQIEFGMRLALTCNVGWVLMPSHVDMMNASRLLGIKIDTTGLLPGPHFASICAYDVTCIDKGPVFRLPITVFQHEQLPATPGPPVHVERNVEFKPSTIKRHFILPPPEATWGVIRISSNSEKENIGRFLVHTMQLLPRKSCRSHETQKLINISSEAPAVLPFKVIGGHTIEVVIAKYWANIGEMNMDYVIEFRGLKTDFGSCLTFHGAEGMQSVTLTSLRREDVCPNVTFKYSEPVLRPSESRISPLSSRDLLPPARQIYQLVNTYTFLITKATEVSPIVALLCDMLYESEYESQIWMLYNSCKQLMAVGDAYPTKYSVKLEKGEYTIRLQVRHEQKLLLEKLSELPVLLQQKLPQPITLDCFSSQCQAITNQKKLSVAYIAGGYTLPLYFAAIPTDKISRSNLTYGQLLTGTVTFTKDELGRKVDTYEIRYIIPEMPKRNNNNKDKDKVKSMDDYMDAVKEFKTTWLSKLEGDKQETLYQELMEDYPDFLGSHICYLSTIDSHTDSKRLPIADKVPEETTEWCEQILKITEKVISRIDQDKLLAYLGMKNDLRTDAAKIKADFDKQKHMLLESLCHRGTSLCRLHAMADNEADRDSYQSQIVANMTDVLKYCDISDSRVIHFGIWYCFTMKQWGRAIKLLYKVHEERPAKEVEERVIGVFKQLGWQYLADFNEKLLPLKYPVAYKLF